MLDRAIARKVISGARAYERLPGSEFIAIAVGQLREALTHIEDLDRAIVAQQNKTTLAERALDDEREAYRKLRERASNIEVAIEILKDIASSQKGGRAKAVAGLKKLGVEEEVVPDPVAVEEVKT